KKETETTMFKSQLSDFRIKEDNAMKEINKLQEKIKTIENGKDVDKLLQSEVVNLRKELHEVKNRETEALEKLQLLDVKETGLKQEISYLSQVEIAQKERITLLEYKLKSKDNDEEFDKLR